MDALRNSLLMIFIILFYSCANIKDNENTISSDINTRTNKTIKELIDGYIVKYSSNTGGTESFIYNIVLSKQDSLIYVSLFKSNYYINVLECLDTLLYEHNCYTYDKYYISIVSNIKVDSLLTTLNFLNCASNHQMSMGLVYSGIYDGPINLESYRFNIFTFKSEMIPNIDRTNPIAGCTEIIEYDQYTLKRKNSR